MSSQQVEFGPESLATAYRIGRRRDSNHATSRNLNCEREQTHINGAKGEVAFADYYGLDIDERDLPDGDEGYDFIVEWFAEPVRVDIKSTTYHNDPWLKVEPDEVLTADVYVLAAVHKASVSLVGWTLASAVARTPATDETGHTENHILRAEDLNQMPQPQEVTTARATHD